MSRACARFVPIWQGSKWTAKVPYLERVPEKRQGFPDGKVCREIDICRLAVSNKEGSNDVVVNSLRFSRGD